MARTKTTAREVAGHTKGSTVEIRKSPRNEPMERGVAGQTKETTVVPSSLPGIEEDNAEVISL